MGAESDTISHMPMPPQGVVWSMTPYTSLVAGANQLTKYKAKKYKRQRIFENRIHQ